MQPLSSEDVGRRVSVRALTGGRGPTGGPEFTDTVGHVLRLDEASVHIERRDGSVTVVPRGAIVAVRRVPDPPPRPA